MRTHVYEKTEWWSTAETNAAESDNNPEIKLEIENVKKGFTYCNHRPSVDSGKFSRKWTVESRHSLKRIHFYALYLATIQRNGPEWSTKDERDTFAHLSRHSPQLRRISVPQNMIAFENVAHPNCNRDQTARVAKRKKKNDFFLYKTGYVTEATVTKRRKKRATR